VGAPLDLYNRPANQFVAGFIGSPRMNFLPGRVREIGADGVAVTVDGLGVVIVGRRAGLAAGDAVTLGVRPEHMVAEPAGVAATVTAVEQLGGLSYVRLAPHDLVLQIAGQTRLTPGESISLRLPAEYVHVFAADGAAVPAALASPLAAVA
jgi:multiple sugar transport system ATP-binding protein